MSEGGVEYSRNGLQLDVVQADILDWDPADARFQVGCLWDIIEHLLQPERYIEKLSGMLPSGGLVALTTGDIASLCAKARGRKWRLIHPPTHIHYFSRCSLTRMLQRFGFRVEYSKYCGFYRSVDNMVLNVLTRRNRRALYERLKRAGMLTGDLYLNTYDILYVIGRKE